MSALTDRDMHLIRKALCIAVLTIERDGRPTRSQSDMQDMKDLLGRVIGSDDEMAIYLRMAQAALPEKLT